MNTRHVQSFLMVSAAFFAMNLPGRPVGAETVGRLAAAVSHTACITSAGLGSEADAKSDDGEESADRS